MTSHLTEVFPLALTADELAVIHQYLGSTDPQDIEAWATSVVQARLADLTPPADPRAILGALDIQPETIDRLQRVADAQFDGDLTWAISEALDGAFAEAWEGEQ